MGITFTVEFLPESYDGLRPDFGVHTCLFDSDLASFIFFQLYLLLMQVVNIVMFSLTIRSMLHTWRATKRMGRHAGGQRRKSSSLNSQIWLVIKLFIVMGITWMSEFVVFLLGWIFGDDVVWRYTIFNDVINLSQGILIFIVLVCKKKIMLRLRDRMGCFCGSRLSASESMMQSQLQLHNQQQQQHRCHRQTKSLHAGYVNNSSSNNRGVLSRTCTCSMDHSTRYITVMTVDANIKLPQLPDEEGNNADAAPTRLMDVSADVTVHSLSAGDLAKANGERTIFKKKLANKKSVSNETDVEVIEKVFADDVPLEHSLTSSEGKERL